MKTGEEKDREQYLTTKQVMDLLQISRSTIHRWIEQGMPHVKAGAHNRFSRAEILAWLEGDDGSEKVQEAQEILQKAQEILDKVENIQKQRETAGQKR